MAAFFIQKHINTNFYPIKEVSFVFLTTIS